MELGVTCDFNIKYYPHPNNKIEIGGHFIFILVLVFHYNSIPSSNSVHPNTTLSVIGIFSILIYDPYKKPFCDMCLGIIEIS
jgi:hypothetical protein